MKCIWLDDIRPVPDYLKNITVYVAKTYDEAVNLISTIDDTDDLCVSFDHDLGLNKNGYDFAKWLVEHKITAFFHIHSMNPVGRDNIRQLLKHYGWKEILLII